MSRKDLSLSLTLTITILSAGGLGIIGRGSCASIKSADVLPCYDSNGVIYIVSAPLLVAIDARTHKQKWALDLKLENSMFA